uniref:DM13 domain-containing protein n=1 Tax=Ditylenchus dipsaci TaxID=166011 RepID=A0A915ED23_9BILA
MRTPAPNLLYNLQGGTTTSVTTSSISTPQGSTTTPVTLHIITSGTSAVWFMVGKEIMPNANGHIVPVYNKASKTFDCDSLKDYTNETITLRLPGSMDIKDVFWFSVFSIPRSVSLAHMYLPYNDMHLPPDLLGVSTPECLWKPK